MALGAEIAPRRYIREYIRVPVFEMRLADFGGAGLAVVFPAMARQALVRLEINPVAIDLVRYQGRLLYVISRYRFAVFGVFFHLGCRAVLIQVHGAAQGLDFGCVCLRCHGSGSIIETPCSKCHGHGRVEKQKTLSVKVPAGVDTGDRIRLSGEGEAGEHGGPPGDLYVHVVVRPHDIFQRDGDDLYCEVPISVVTASLGGELEIPTLDGRVNLKIPAESQSGKLFRLRGKGVKSVRGSKQGDLLCRISVETPVNLTKKQKELLKEFEASMHEDNVNHSPRASSWLDGVKKFFEDMKT